VDRSPRRAHARQLLRWSMGPRRRDLRLTVLKWQWNRVRCQLSRVGDHCRIGAGAHTGGCERGCNLLQHRVLYTWRAWCPCMVRWGRRPVHGGRGAGVPECGHPPAEQAGHTPAVDAASCVFPAFAHGPVGPPLVVAAMLGV